MSGRASRQKGATAEREIVELLNDRGYDCHRTPHSGALEWMKGDVTGLPFHIEVKRCEALRIPEWCAKAEAEAGDKPCLVVFRRSREPWRVVVKLQTFLDLMECGGMRLEGSIGPGIIRSTKKCPGECDLPERDPKVVPFEYF